MGVARRSRRKTEYFLYEGLILFKMKKNYLLIILLAFFCIANVGVSGKGNFSDGGGILYTQPVKSVLFRHQHHVDVKKISCEKCHSGLFEMQALLAQEKKDFVMESLYRGRYCGACHNGKDAFAAQNQCARCHPRISEKEVGHVKGKPKPYKAPVYNTTVAMGKDQQQVLFKHEKHASLNCMDCHSKLFKIKKGIKQNRSGNAQVTTILFQLPQREERIFVE